MSSIYSSPAQPCQRCGRPLPPNEAYCGNCGLYNTPAPVNNFAAQSPVGPGGSGSSFYGTPGQQSSPNLFSGAPSQQPASPASFYGAAPQQTFTPQPNPVTGGFQPGSMPGFQSPGFSQYPVNAGFQPGSMPGFQPPGFPQSPAKKRRPRIGLIIGIVVILLIIIGGSIGGYAYLKKQSTTPIVQATATTAPTSIPRGKPLFSDVFLNNKNAWDTTSKAGEFSAKVGNGSLVLEDDNHKLLWELVPGGKNFGDFFLTADAVLSMGGQDNGYGIYIRGASNQNLDIATYYRFELYGDGTFAIFKGTVDGTGTSTSTPLVKDSPNAAIQKQGKVNHIAISAKGPTMSLIVNGQTLEIVTDNTYASGSIAFFVSNLPAAPSGAQATFSNFVIYPPQS